MPDISIITVTFNNYEELVKTLESTEGAPCERVVINGGSCERTKKLLVSRTDIKSVSEPDGGIADAFNKGVKLATGAGIWFLHSGDLCVDKSFLNFATEKLKDFDFIYSDILLNHQRKGVIPIQRNRKKSLGFGMPYLHPGLIMRRSIFNEVGFFKTDYKIAMDYELLCRMSKLPYKGIFYERPTVLMDGTGISNSNHFDSIKEMRKALAENELISPVNTLALGWLTLKTTIREKLVRT